MKRALIALPVILITLLAIMMVAPGFIDWSQYKQPAIDQIKQTSGYDVELDGKLNMTLLPSPQVYIENVKIKAPEGSAEPYLASMERLDMHLALAPLLSGRAEFSSVELIKPVIALQVFEDGRQNWMTPELERMSKGTEDGSAAPGKTPEISLQNVRIADGRFQYRDEQTGKSFDVQAINVDMSADTLQGPFAAKGSAGYGGQAYTFDAKTGEWDREGGSVPLNLNAGLKDADAEVVFAGVVATKAPFGLQGETSMAADSFSEVLRSTGGAAPVAVGAVKVKGLLTAGPEKIEYKNVTLQLADGTFNGDFGAVMKPLKVAGSFVSDDTVNLDQLIKMPAQKQGQGGGLESLGNMLPRSFTLPAAFEADFKMTAPAVVFNGAVYKDVTLSFAKGEKNFGGGFAAQEIPGGGPLEVSADLAFGAKSVSSADGSETYSDPQLVVAVKGKPRNLSETAKALPGGHQLALPAGWKSGTLSSGIVIAPGALTLQKSQLQFGETAIEVSGSYNTTGKRPKAVVDAAVNILDLDALAGANEKSAGSGDLAQTLKSFSLPYDLDFDVGIQQARLQGHDVKGLRAQGTVRQNALSFSNLSAQEFAGSSFKVSGGISDLKTLSGIDVKLEGQSQDVQALAKTLGVDASALPENVKSASGSVAAKGNVSEVDTTASIAALGGSFTAKGKVVDPLGTMSIGNLAVQIKHQNMNDALKMFAPSAPRYASWEKPMDIAVDVYQGDASTGFENIKGNLAGATVAGSLRVHPYGEKPSVSGELTFGKLVMVSSKGSSKSGNVQTIRPTGSQRWSKAPMDTAWMNSFNADIDISAEAIQYETWDLQKPVLDVMLENGTLSIHKIGSDLFGGEVALTGTAVSSPDGKGPLKIDMRTNLRGVSVEKMVTAFVGNRILEAQGTIDSFEINTKGAGASQHALVSSLTGTGQIGGRNIVLEGFDLKRFAKAMSEETKPGDTVLGLWKTSTKGGSTAFDILSGDFTLTNGVANINKLNLDGPTAAITTTGNVNLPQWTIQTAHTITLKNGEDVPPFTVNISGPLDNPGNTFGQGLINDYLKRKINRKLESLITDKLGAELGLSPAPAAGEEAAPPPEGQPLQPQPQEFTPEEAIKGVLDGLLRQ